EPAVWRARNNVRRKRRSDGEAGVDCVFAVALLALAEFVCRDAHGSGCWIRPMKEMTMLDDVMLRDVTLEDKYTVERGRIYLSGIQALVRLPMMQRQRDLAAGLNTGGFISGYRGSPLGNYDSALWKARKHLVEQNIHFQPGLNED